MANAKAKGRNVRRSSGRRRARPKVRFSIWGLILLFALAFAACFVLYMVKANLDQNFLEEEFGSLISEESNTVETEEATEPEEPVDEEESEEETTVQRAEITNPVPQSEAPEEGYFDHTCLITDSTLLKMAEFSTLTDVIGGESLNALNCNSTKVESNYGTVTVYETIQIKKPENVYIMLGSNIGTDPTDEMIENYSKLINDLHTARPDMNIYVMQYPPAKQSEESSKNELINEYNSKLLEMANKYQVYCIDTNTALKNQDGVLAPEYLDEEGKYNETAYSTVTGYILTHVAS